MDFEIDEVPAEEEICNAILNPRTLERADIGDIGEENSESPPPNKEIVGNLSVLGQAVQHHADEKDFERHYSYEWRKKTDIDKLIFYVTYMI